MNELKNEKREIVKVLILNTKNIVLKILDISYGSTNLAIIEPREILVEPINEKDFWYTKWKRPIENRIKNKKLGHSSLLCPIKLEKYWRKQK